jgi:ribonuclease HI
MSIELTPNWRKPSSHYYSSVPTKSFTSKPNLNKNESYLLRCDGSAVNYPELSQRHAHIGSGVVLYDSDENLIHQCGIYNGYHASSYLEYYALIHGLNIAREYQITKIVVELDFKPLITVLDKHMHNELHYEELSPEFVKLLDVILKPLEQFKFWKIQHLPRKFNMIADSLAYKAAILGRDQMLKVNEVIYG